jgi:hypothetical protein
MGCIAHDPCETAHPALWQVCRPHDEVIEPVFLAREIQAAGVGIRIVSKLNNGLQECATQRDVICRHFPRWVTNPKYGNFPLQG